MTVPDAPVVMPYATPAGNIRPVWAAAVLVMLSLGLITLAGCFLVGIGVAFDLIGVVNQSTLPWSSGQYAFVAVLYVVVAITFIAGLYTAVLAVRHVNGKA